MNRLFASLLAVAFAMTALVASSTQPASLFRPTQAHAAAPVTFPEKGRPVTLIVPFGAGGGTDLAARVLAPLVERELGVPIQVVDRPGAGTQKGLTELAKSKPDGYTIGYAIIPSVLATYLDPERRAIYNRTDFTTIATQFDQGYVMGVHKDSPYKTLSDLVADVKARPNAIKFGTTGLMASGHLVTLQFQKLVGTPLLLVHFDGSGPQMTALAGQHVDVIMTGQAEFLPFFKAGTFRALALLDKQENPDFPGVKTAIEQGYRLWHLVTGTICAPKGLPQDVLDVWSNAVRKVINSDEHKQRMRTIGFPTTYRSPQEAANNWAEVEAEMRPIIEEALRSK